MRLNAGSGILIALMCASAARGQGSREGTGTVTGHVTCADTRQPARFAGVTLYGVPENLSSVPDPKHPANEFDGTMLTGQTGMDGSFVVNNVPPGDYYAIGTVRGYETPRTLLESAYNAGVDLTKGIPGLLTLHVSADRIAQAEISVQPGAAIDGHVRWDDGSPVRDAMVRVELAAKEKQRLPEQFGMLMAIGSFGGFWNMTDDRGHYRVAGLGPGDYVVEATLATNQRMVVNRGSASGMILMTSTPLEVYAPAAFHRGEAKPLKLDRGEEHDDEDITFNVSGTHSVSGTVVSAEDHHGIGSGVMQLSDATDASFQRGAGVDAQGNFTINFVPQGTYVLTVHDAADTSPADMKPGADPNTPSVKIERDYSDTKQQIVVTDSDVTGQNIEVTASKQGPKTASTVDGALRGVE
jgi:hypothetical protein